MENLGIEGPIARFIR